MHVWYAPTTYRSDAVMLQQKCCLHPKSLESVCANTLSAKLVCSPLVKSSRFSQSMSIYKQYLGRWLAAIKQLQHTPDACAYVQMWCFHSNQASVLTQQKVSPLPCLHQISKQDPDRARARPGAEKRYVLHIHHGSRHQKLHVSWAVIVQCHVKMWHRAIHHCYIMILHVSLSHGLYAAGPCFEHAGLFTCTQSHLTSTLRSRWLWDDVFMGSMDVHSFVYTPAEATFTLFAHMHFAPHDWRFSIKPLVHL